MTIGFFNLYVNSHLLCSLSKSMESTQIQDCCNDAQRLVEALKVATEHADLLEIDIKRNREKIKRLEEKNKW